MDARDYRPLLIVRFEFVSDWKPTDQRSVGIARRLGGELAGMCGGCDAGLLPQCPESGAGAITRFYPQ